MEVDPWTDQIVAEINRRQTLILKTDGHYGQPGQLYLHSIANGWEWRASSQ
jgi:hypothetical protein